MSELMWWLAQPSSVLAGALLLALLAAAVRWAAAVRALLAAATLLLVAVAFAPLDHWIAAPLERRYAPSASLPARVDGIVVLGGGVDWRVSAARDQLALNDAGERVVAGAALARRYPDAELVLTGLFAETAPHDFQARPDARSLLWGPELAGARFLGEARSTYEEALAALEAVQPRGGETWLLVTSALHMPRALGVFETLGWSVTPYPVDYRTAGTARWALRPNLARELAELDRAVREWGALRIYRETGRIAP